MSPAAFTHCPQQRWVPLSSTLVSARATPAAANRTAIVATARTLTRCMGQSLWKKFAGERSGEKIGERGILSPDAGCRNHSIPCGRYTGSIPGPVAQRSEQGTHNPLVLGSNPSGPIHVGE